VYGAALQPVAQVVGVDSKLGLTMVQSALEPSDAPEPAGA